MRAVLVFTAARLGLFAVPFVVLLYVFGTQLWPFSALVSLLISAIAGYFLLRRQRDAVGELFVRGTRRVSDAVDAGAAAEDSPAEGGSPRSG